MSFFTFMNRDIQFAEKELTWMIYSTKNALLTIRQVKLIVNKKFAKAVFNENVEAFVVHLASFTSNMTIYLAKEAQIASLLAEKVTVPVEYADFINIFSKKLTKELPKRTDINKHTIKLEESKQPPYRPIYSLGQVEFETLKTYIKTNLANDFI